jgi:hypothetical protein
MTSAAIRRQNLRIHSACNCQASSGFPVLVFTVLKSTALPGSAVAPSYALDRSCFSTWGFARTIPNYFFGSNADAIVGGSKRAA